MICTDLCKFLELLFSIHLHFDEKIISNYDGRSSAFAPSKADFRAVVDKSSNAFTREDVVSTKALLDFAHLYKKNLVDNLSCMQT